MESFQTSAMRTLSLAGYLDSTDFSRRQIRLLDKDFAEPLLSRIAEANKNELDVMQALSKIAKGYAVLGKDGLKDRTGLLEYRYDSV